MKTMQNFSKSDSFRSMAKPGRFEAPLFSYQAFFKQKWKGAERKGKEWNGKEWKGKEWNKHEKSKCEH